MNEETRYGTWYQKKITIPKGRGQTYLVWACSRCRCHERKRSRFCPNCGKPMGGVDVMEGENDDRTDE